MSFLKVYIIILGAEQAVMSADPPEFADIFLKVIFNAETFWYKNKFI